MFNSYSGGSNDEQRIRDRMNERRQLAESQMKSDDMRSTLIDSFRAKKNDHIKTKLEEIKATDKVLWDYINHLEMVNKGIWCATCERPKTVESLEPAEKPATQQPDPEMMKKLQQQVEMLTNQLEHLKTNTAEVKSSFESDAFDLLTRAEKIYTELESLQNKCRLTRLAMEQ